MAAIKKICLVVILLLCIFYKNNIVFAEINIINCDDIVKINDRVKINIDVKEQTVIISGGIEEVNHEILLTIYRNSDFAECLKLTSRTDCSGAVSIKVSLPPETYTAVISAGIHEYYSDNIIILNSGSIYEKTKELKVSVNENSATIKGTLNEINENIIITIYRRSDYIKEYIYHKKTDDNGEYELNMNIMEGDYIVGINTDDNFQCYEYMKIPCNKIKQAIIKKALTYIVIIESTCNII